MSNEEIISTLKARARININKAIDAEKRGFHRTYCEQFLNRAMEDCELIAEVTSLPLRGFIANAVALEAVDYYNSLRAENGLQAT